MKKNKTKKNKIDQKWKKKENRKNNQLLKEIVDLRRKLLKGKKGGRK